MILQLHKQLLLLLLVACWTDGLEGKQYARQRRREALRGLRNVRALQATKEDDIPLDGKGMSDGKPEGKGCRKYAESGNSLDVPSTQEMDDESVALVIEEEGRGIPEDSREKVFQRFHSVRPAEEDFGNHSGLGLAIARAIAEAHDGTLTAQARPDGGTGACLRLRLPAAA